jgi:hypothetical protein
MSEGKRIPVLSGPSFEPTVTEFYEASKCLRCGNQERGAHYNLYHIKGGVQALKEMFPEGKANDLNFVLFSTSGVHGSYITIEEIEESLKKYGLDWEPEDDERLPNDWCGDELTVLIVHPRIVCLRYGNIKVTLKDIPFLKKLRKSSWKAIQKIGAGHE